MSLTDIHLFLSFALLYSQFCRAVKTDITTKLPVLLAFYLLTASSIFSLFAPIVVPGWQTTPDHVMLLLSILILQVVTAFNWRDGVPMAFRKQSNDEFKDSLPIDDDFPDSIRME